MSRRMHMAARTLSLMFAAVLSVAAPTSVSAADRAATPSAQPESQAASRAQQLQELDEVWVRGERLSDVIEKAEDEFFKAYNKVNRNHDYDVHCGEVQLSRISLAMTRTCLPGFYVYNYLDLAGRAVPQCSSMSSGDGSSDLYSGGVFYTGCTYAPLVPPELMAMEHRKRYSKNVLQVINSNERLLTMASKLTGLYGEMAAVQTSYVKIRSSNQPVRPARQKQRKSAPATGPRTL